MHKKPPISDLDRIEVGDLLRMLIVAKHGSINRSALALNTSQPTLTRRLRRLELALGRHVLERSGTGVCLTAFGRDIAEHGRVIERALAAIAQLADLSHVQDIYLGATQLAAELILPRAIHSISAAPSQMRVVAQEGTCEALLRQLQEGELDVLIASPGVKAKEVPGVDFRPLFWLQLGVIACKGHPLADCLSGVPDLSQAKWVLFGGDADFTLRAETELNSRGIKVSQNAPMLPSHSAVLQFLRENDALTVLPIEILLNQLLIREFVVLRGDWSLSKYPCGVYTRRDYKTERHIPGLIGAIEQVVRELSLSRNGL